MLSFFLLLVKTRAVVVERNTRADKDKLRQRDRDRETEGDGKKTPLHLISLAARRGRGVGRESDGWTADRRADSQVMRGG